MTKSLEYYDEITNNAMKRDRNKVAMMEKIDDMRDCNFDLPVEMAELPGMRNIVSTDPHDSLGASTRTFATLNPKFELTPLGPQKEDEDYAEKIEANIKWHWYQMNRRGTKEPLYELVKSGLTYSAIGFFVEYLPYSMKDRTDPRSKYLRRAGDFVWHMYNVKNVRPHYDSYGLSAITMRSIMTAAEVVANCGEDNPGVRQMLSDISSQKDVKTPKDRNNIRILFSDYMDWTDRVKWMSIIGNAADYDQWGDTNSITVTKKYEIERAEHGLGFFPFVYREGDDPLLKAIVDTNAWADLNILLSLRNWLVYRAASQPAYKTQTPNRRGIAVDFTDGNGTLDLAPGESADPMAPRQLDPHLSEILTERQQAIHTSTVAKALQSLEFSGNMPFATVNAILEAAVQSLTMQRKLIEKAIEDGIYAELNWINHSKIGLVGRRMNTSDEDTETQKRGAQILLEPDTFDPNEINIACTLQADTPTDKQQRLNEAVSLHRDMKLPLTFCYEMLGIDNGEILHNQWAEGELNDAEIQVELKKMSGEVDLELKQKEMEMMQKAQADQAAQAQNQNNGQNTPANIPQGQSAPVKGQPMPQDASQIPTGMPQDQSQTANMVEGQGYNPAAGGQPPQLPVPNQTREQRTGRTWVK
jgi:hypothetical protein